MKLYVTILLLLVCFSFEVTAQSPISYQRATGEDRKESEGGGSVYNPYYDKMKGGVDFKALGNLPEIRRNFWPKATFLYELLKNEKRDSQIFHLPVVSSISVPSIEVDSILTAVTNIRQALQAEGGISIGLYPYLIIKPRKQEEKTYAVLHAEVSSTYSLVTTKEASINTTEVQLAYASFGVEYGIRRSSNNPNSKGAFTTVNLFGYYSALSQEVGEEEANEFGLGASVLFPISGRLLIALESYVNTSGASFYGVGVSVPFENNSRNE